jgi:hypothetical protein
VGCAEWAYFLSGVKTAPSIIPPLGATELVSNVAPIAASHERRNCGLCNIKLVGQCLLRCPTLVCFEDCNYRNLSKHCVWMLFATPKLISRFEVRILASLLHAILLVIFGCAKKQVAWVAATRIITTMADKPTLWDRLSMSQLESYAMSIKPLVVEGNPTIPVFHNTTRPWPTIIGSAFIYSTPKALWKTVSKLFPIFTKGRSLRFGNWHTCYNICAT